VVHQLGFGYKGNTTFWSLSLLPSLGTIVEVTAVGPLDGANLYPLYGDMNSAQHDSYFYLMMEAEPASERSCFLTKKDQ
jgi:hypothetical protein